MGKMRSPRENPGRSNRGLPQDFGVKPLKLKQERINKPSVTPAQASHLPVASVLVDTGLIHLDQEFDFLVPQEMAHFISPGVVVKVPFHGRQVLGLIMSRRERSSFHGELRYISELVKPFPLITSAVLRLCSEVSRYYGGARWDVLRFAFPALAKRDQRKEFTSSNEVTREFKANIAKSRPRDQRYAEGFWEAFSHTPNPEKLVRAYWSPPSGEDSFTFLRTLIANTSRSVLVVFPDSSDVERFRDQIKIDDFFSTRSIIAWHSQMNRTERAKAFMEILSGTDSIVLGVRGSLFLPIQNLDAIVLWDEASESHSEQRSPYFHSREVAIMRANIEKCHLFIAGFSPSIHSALYIERKYLSVLNISPDQRITQNIQVRGIHERSSPQESGRISTAAWRTIKTGLAAGPVLVQVPIKGYIQALSCGSCRNRAFCSCGGKLIWAQRGQSPTCTLCQSENFLWRCPYCGGVSLRYSQVGDSRIVEELGKAFPNQSIIFSNKDHRIHKVASDRLLVVSTPGAEPIAESGYSAIVILNANLLLDLAKLDSEVEARNRWFALGTLLCPQGTLYLDIDSSNRNFQALLRWNPIGIAMVELEERRVLKLPPTVKTLEIFGRSEAVAEVIRNLPDYVHLSRPRISETGESVVLLRIIHADPNPVIREIFKRTIQQSAGGSPCARVKIDPISI